MKRDGERRFDEETAKAFEGTVFDRRDHSDAECEAEPVLFGDPTRCRRCGRQMTHFESLIYRSL